MISHPVLGTIVAHTQAVQRGQVECKVDQCPHCNQRSVDFKYHACRRRWFYVTVEQVVQQMRSVLTRWKFLVWHKAFIDYPDFALPYKRYVRQDLCQLSGRYVFDDSVSYRKTVRVNGNAGLLQRGRGREPAHRRAHTLTHSTVHRWISFLGDLKQTLAQAWQLIRAKSPSCELFRTSTAVASWKYRSQHRKILLQTCGRLLRIDHAYRHLFEVSIFTHLAIVCRWR